MEHMKTYILDTSVIINAPSCLNDFKNAKIIISIDVLNELDKLKTKPNEVGKNARVFIRMLDKLLEGSSLETGVSFND